MDRRHRHRWPQPLRHDGRDFLTTAQVSRVLGITPQSVYAYVSRGQLDSVRISGIRGSLFAVGEVEAFRRRTIRRPPAGIVERIRTEVTLIDDDHLYYRGRDATELARTSTFLDVAEMLWGTTARRDHDETTRETVIPPDLPDAGRGLDTIRMTVDMLCAADEHRGDLVSDAVARKAANVLDAVVDGLPIVGTARGGSTFAHRLWSRVSPMAPAPRRIELLDSALVLLADHDLAASTMAARVAASAGGSVYAVISAGLGAFDGPLHGGATAVAHDFLRAALADPLGPENVVAQHCGRGQSIPGCGHVLCRHRDPRAEMLLDALAADGMPQPLARTLDAVRRGAAATDAGVVTSDLAVAAIAIRYRMVPDAAQTIFAVARIAGWVAHGLEEYREPRLRYRPEGVYTGVRPGRRSPDPAGRPAS